MIKLEGVKINTEMLNLMQDWQKNPDMLTADIQAVEEAVSYIACSHDHLPKDNYKQALEIIANLCHIKTYLVYFHGKEDKE